MIVVRQVEVVEALLKNKQVDVNIQETKTNATPLMLTINKDKKSIYKQTDIVSILLRRKDIQVNLYSTYGTTALMFASTCTSMLERTIRLTTNALFDRWT